MKWRAKWIKPQNNMGEVASLFTRKFVLQKECKSATLYITAMGTYTVLINGKSPSNYVLAPGWTTYKKRLQYQEYDIIEYLQEHNELSITVGKGWYRSQISGVLQEKLCKQPCGLFAQLEIQYLDGSCETVITDENWNVCESPVRYSDIYHGEIYDARVVSRIFSEVEVFEGPTHTLILQEGEKIVEHEVVYAARVITTPKGEVVVDFGQNMAGYVEIHVQAHEGDVVQITHGEVLDKNGNFYNANYRQAKAELTYICKDGEQIYHPQFTFFGFRYVRVKEFPGGLDKVKAENFRAIAVYSDIRQTGYINCSHTLLNRLFDNIIWSQRGNFLDVPTDCPQRDERLGWTGDAQVFVKSAALNYDVEKFFYKWLGCLKADQGEDGYVGYFVPDTARFPNSVAGWGDAAVICPWEIYMAYGNEEILKRQFHSMKKRVDYITHVTKDEGLWTGMQQHGDWLGLDSAEGSYKGASNEELIATAYYAHVTLLLVKAGKIIGEDMTEYEKQYERIVSAFRSRFTHYNTQTECAIAVHFRLAENCQIVADQLADMILQKGHLTTGFLGTPYLLHALSDYGHAKVAYDLLLRTEYPSWLYEVCRGATTIWEHWDSIKEDGSFWSTEMNSFNHYAYGSVIDWVYTVAGGIRQVEQYPGYERVIIAPTPDCRLEHMTVALQTRYGRIVSEWKMQDALWRYEITTPVKTKIVIQEKTYDVEPGNYIFYSEKS